MDLSGVLSTLESHWVVLEAELNEIRKDYAAMRTLTRKYGEYWNCSLATLKKLRVQKENLLKECVPLAEADCPAPPQPPQRRRRAAARVSPSRSHIEPRRHTQDQVPDGAI